MPTTELSNIIKTDAKIALPEIVSIFVAKHETQLYDQKDALQESISTSQKDLTMHEAVVLGTADFKKYDNITIPILELVSVLKGDASVNWETGLINQTVTFHNVGKGREKHTGFAKSFSMDIGKGYVKTRDSIRKSIQNDTDDLKSILAQISDMSRKERQIKARISEIRLEESGLTDFLKDKEILKLIQLT